MGKTKAIDIWTRESLSSPEGNMPIMGNSACKGLGIWYTEGIEETGVVYGFYSSRLVSVNFRQREACIKHLGSDFDRIHIFEP